MNPERQSQQQIESKEKPDFEISIIVHRHGPKEGIAGRLSSEGEELTEKYFTDAYKGIVFDDRTDGADVEYSPIGRAQKTAEIYSDIVRHYGIGNIRSSRTDERLSEGNIAEHPDLIEQYGGRGSMWLKGWMGAEKRPLPDVKTGKEAAADFADWLLSKIFNRAKEGGVQEVDAFSHGPVMVAFILKLEEKLGEKILPENIQDKNIFENIFNYLSSMNFYTDSSRPNVIAFSFAGKKFDLPISLLQELVYENQLKNDHQT